MPIKIKSTAEIREKWQRVAPGRQQDFEDGVKDPDVDWARNAAAASQSFEDGIQDAIQRGAFTKGVNAAGNEKWQRKVVEIGVGRWGPGVRASGTDFEDGFGKFRDAIERLDLPPRRPRGDPGNIERVAAVARALAELRKR